MPETQTTQKDPVIVVLQLTGGNDYLNTVIPYTNPLYRDNRKAVGIPDNQIMHLDKDYGIPHYMAPIKQFWDDNKLAFLPTIQGEQRKQVLERFAAMYKPAIGTGAVMDYMADTGIDSLKGEDILKVAPQKYSSTVQYPNTPIARKLKGIAQTHLADLGSRIFYCDHSTFDIYVG